jgi:hypothetical protein
MELVAVDYSAGFNLRFERKNNPIDLPNVLILEIKADAYVGDSASWSGFIKSLPLTSRRGENGEPALAYRLMLLIGSTVTFAKISENSDLIIETSDNEAITIVGNDDVWEESWIVRELGNVNDPKLRFIQCLDNGTITSNLN